VVILKEKPKTKQFWQELSITNKRFSSHYIGGYVNKSSAVGQYQMHRFVKFACVK